MWWSDELYRIYGLEPGAIEPSYEEFLNHVHPDDRDAVDERNRQAFADHQPFEDVKRVVRADGREINMRTQGEVITDTDGQPAAHGRHLRGRHRSAARARGREAPRRRRGAAPARGRQINDEIIQRLVLVAALLQRGEVDRASAHVSETLTCAKRIAGDLIIGDAPVTPGALRRSSSAA